MEHYVPYARSDVGSSQVESIVEWLGVNELLARMRQLPPESEFSILLDFLVEFAGGLELAEHRMAETLVEQSAISCKAHAEVVKMVKRRLTELYNDAAKVAPRTIIEDGEENAEKESKSDGSSVQRKENITIGNKNSVTYSPFYGCTIVATGKLEHFTRDGINSKIASLGATAGSSVTRKTSYVICGEKPGSKLTKARELGIPILTEQEFLSMIPA